MQRWMTWTAGIVGLLLLVLAGLVLAGTEMAQRKRSRVVMLQVAAVPYVDDAQSLEHGKYLFQSRGCVDCHGVTGTGRSFVNDGKGTHIAGPNITPAGVVAKYQPHDWVRTIRHGVKPDGRPVLIMPSEDYNRLTDADLAALVAYTRSLAPAPGSAAVVELPLPVWVLYGFDAIPDAAQRIDHALAPSTPVPSGVTVAHGAYVANMCIGCHGERLSGGKIPSGPPDWPAAANITPGDGSAMARYQDADALLAMFRSGKRSDGSTIAVMPFEPLSKLDAVDVRALHAFLQTVPPRPAGQR